MASIIIKTFPSHIRRNAIFCDNLVDFVTEHQSEYNIIGSFDLPNVSGEDAAEEVFNLTNNPSRQTEREQIYGNGPSVSVGDVVEVDGISFLCENMGWTELN